MQQVERGYVYQDRRMRDVAVRPRVTRQQRKKAEMTARDRGRILMALFVAAVDQVEGEVEDSERPQPQTAPDPFNVTNVEEYKV